MRSPSTLRRWRALAVVLYVAAITVGFVLGAATIWGGALIYAGTFGVVLLVTVQRPAAGAAAAVVAVAAGVVISLVSGHSVGFPVYTAGVFGLAIGLFMRRKSKPTLS